MKIVVVGGGIMGLCVAWAAARAGHEVELFEQGPLPNPLASSFDHSRLIRYPYGAKRAYARMVRHAYAANARLFAELGVTPYDETGTLVVVRGHDPWIDATRASLDELGVVHDLLGPARVADRFALLDPAGITNGLWTPTGGILLARQLLEALVEWLRRQPGVALVDRTPIGQLDAGRAAVTTAAGKLHRGDRLVIAAGPWTGDLLAGWRGRVRPSRQIVVDLAVADELRPAWAAMPMVLDGIAWRGSGFYAVPPVRGRALKVGDHTFSLRGHPEAEREPRAAERDAIFALARRGLRDKGAYSVSEARSCYYTVAAEERFIAESRGPTLVLAGFSGHGFKFGPLVGLAVARHLAGEIVADDLARWLAGRDVAPPAALARDGLMTTGGVLR